MRDITSASDATLAVRRQAVADAGSALRATMLALIETEVPADVLVETAEELQVLAARLASKRRQLNQLPSVDNLSQGVQMFSPVVGEGNPQAPPLKFYGTSDGVAATTTLDRRFEGPPGLVHGGQTALMLDEVLAQAMLHSDRWGLTAQLNVQYKQAIPLDTSVLLFSKITECEGRRTTVSGGISSPDRSEDYVLAHAVFISPRAERHDSYFGRIVDSEGQQASAKLERPNTKRGVSGNGQSNKGRFF